jgi:hypothetical protein
MCVTHIYDKPAKAVKSRLLIQEVKAMRLFFLSLLCLLTPSVWAADPLSVAQVEKITGLSGLSVTASKYDKGGISFVTADKDLVLAVKLQSAQIYEVWKSQPSFSDQTPLAGIGAEAVVSKTGRYVCFKKADKGICVTAMPERRNKPTLVSDAQLIELARAAAANQ